MKAREGIGEEGRREGNEKKGKNVENFFYFNLTFLLMIVTRS